MLLFTLAGLWMNEWCIQVPNTHLNTPVTSTNDQSHSCCSFLWAFPLSAALISTYSEHICTLLSAPCFPEQLLSTRANTQYRNRFPNPQKLSSAGGQAGRGAGCGQHLSAMCASSGGFPELQAAWQALFDSIVLYVYNLYFCNIVCVGDLIFYDHQQHFRIVLSTEQEMKKIVISNVKRWSEDTNSL